MTCLYHQVHPGKRAWFRVLDPNSIQDGVISKALLSIGLVDMVSKLD